MTLRGRKAIIERIEAVWKVAPSERSLSRWAKLKDDPLPLKRMLVVGNKGIPFVDAAALDAWAQRHKPE